MIKSLSFLIIFLFPIVSSGADGVNGCLIMTGITNQQRLYHTPYPEWVGSFSEWIATGNTAGFNVVTQSKCFQAIGPPCVVYKFGTTGTVHTADDVLYAGNYALVVPCPIDDYVPFALVVAAGFGAFILRKRETELQA